MLTGSGNVSWYIIGDDTPELRVKLRQGAAFAGANVAVEDCQAVTVPDAGASPTYRCLTVGRIRADNQRSGSQAEVRTYDTVLATNCVHNSNPSQ